jgi:aldehyde dehydrogenase (NAD+)
MHEYLAAPWETSPPGAPASASATVWAAPDEAARPAAELPALPEIDRTAKLYIGGKQVRPDSGYSYTVRDRLGAAAGLAPLGNRKDIRNAVEAAASARAWGGLTAHNRSQVLYFLAENLAARSTEFERRIAAAGGTTPGAAAREVACAIERTFWYAAWADKYDGRVHATKSRHLTLAVKEPWGVMGVVCPAELPLLGFVSLVMPAIAMGNRVVVVPSQEQPLAATDFYQVLDTSDVPGGVVNIVTGERDVLAQVLAQHDDVAAVWYRGSASGSAAVESASAGNLKATWVDHGRTCDLFSATAGQGREYLRRATQIKTIWVPYGI